MLGLTKTRRQADMRKSGPSGKRRARFFAAHRYRKSGPRKTALTGLRKKKNDCRYIDDTGACITPEARGGGLPPFKGIGRRSWKGHGESKEEARKGQGKSTEKTRREQGGSKERARKEHGEDTERARREQGRARESKERARKEHGEDTERARREQGRARESKERARKGQGGSTERARKEHGEGTERPQKTGRGSKEGQERLKRAGWRGKEPAGGGKCRLRCMDTKKPAPSSGAGTLLGRSPIRASRHCQPSHARGWRTHA